MTSHSLVNTLHIYILTSFMYTYCSRLSDRFYLLVHQEFGGDLIYKACSLSKPTEPFPLSSIDSR